MPSVLKKKGYEIPVLRLAKASPMHPLHFGLIMQAHHLLSEKAIALSGIGSDLVDYHYEIDDIKNLSLIPSTLAGACHLGTQIHRGDHKNKQLVLDDDGIHEDTTYHEYVSRRIRNYQEKIDDECGDKDPGVQKLMNGLSYKILKKIRNFSLMLTMDEASGKEHPLHPNNHLGCKNMLEMKPFRASDTPCGSERNHYGQYHQFSAKYKKREKITWPNGRDYKLQLGK